MRFLFGPALVVACGASGLFSTACSSDDDATPMSDAGADVGGLYVRLGGHAGISSTVDKIVAAEVQDPEIAAFFAPNTQVGHTPSVAQIEECLVNQLGSAAGGPEMYPATVTGGFHCRSMKDAHSALHIPGTTFDKFVQIAATTLKSNGVSDADVATIGGVLNGTRNDIVDPNANPNTLYGRLGENAGITSVVDAIVTAEVADPEIAAFFAPNTQPDHTPSVTQINECLVNQLGNAAGGPEVYPAMVSGGFTCRSMVDAHAALDISGPVFDKFVAIAAQALKSKGVSDDDIATIGGVLNGTKADIVKTDGGT